MLGTQRLFELFRCDPTLLDDVTAMARVIRAAVVGAGGTILHEKVTPLAPRGVLALYALAGGRLVVDTAPDEAYAAIDLHLRGDGVDVDRLVAALEKELGSSRSAATSIERARSGNGVSEGSDADRGEAPASIGGDAARVFRPLHPELFTYDAAFVERFIDPRVRSVDRANARELVREVCEQVYQFRLFTPEFCRLLVEEAERSGAWVTVLERTIEKHGALDGVDDLIEPDTSLSWEQLPGMIDVYRQIIEHHVRPMVEGLWVTFKLQKWDVPGVRRYEPDVVAGMDLHYDAETVGMIGYLSDGFTGGGTHFPRWNAVVGRGGEVIVGSVVVYPGGVSHEHAALPVASGRRYTLSNSLY